MDRLRKQKIIILLWLFNKLDSSQFFFGYLMFRSYDKVIHYRMENWPLHPTIGAVIHVTHTTS